MGTDHPAELRRQEEQARDVLRRLRAFRETLPAEHPSTSLLDTAVARATVHWHGLRSDQQALERARRPRPRSPCNEPYSA